MEVVRITELQPKTTVEDGDYIAIDNINNGTNKVQVVNLLDATLSQENKMAPANIVGQQFTNTNAEITALRAAVGSPLKASTVAQMTDTNKIYVYTGSETGYTSGHWYYWNGTAWTDGGVYNSVAVETDPTLTISGMPADAKVTGDKFSNLNLAFDMGSVGTITPTQASYGWDGDTNPSAFRSYPECISFWFYAKKGVRYHFEASNHTCFGIYAFPKFDLTNFPETIKGVQVLQDDTLSSYDYVNEDYECLCFYVRHKRNSDIVPTVSITGEYVSSVVAKKADISYDAVGKEIVTEYTPLSGFIYDTGAVDTTANEYNRTVPIAVSSGDTVNFSCACYGDTAALAFSEDGETWTCVLVGKSNNAINDYSYTFPYDGYMSISYRCNQFGMSMALTRYATNGLAKRVDELEKETLSNSIALGVTVSKDYFSMDGYITVDGTESTGSSYGFKRTLPIQVYQGDSIEFTLCGYYDSPALSFKTDLSEATWTTLLNGTRSTITQGVSDFEYTFTEDGYIVLSYYATYGLDMTLYHPASKGLFKDVEALSKKIQIVDRRYSAFKDFGEQPPANGTSGSFCNMSQGYNQLLADVYEPLRTAYPNYITRENVGKDASGTYDMYIYTFEPRYYQQSILLVAGIHANEPDAIASLARIMQLICTSEDEDLKFIRENVKVTVIPCVNVWGFSQSPKKRTNADNVEIQTQWNAENPIAEVANLRPKIFALKDELAFIQDMHTTTNNTYLDFYGVINKNGKNVRTLFRTNAWLCEQYAKDGRTVDDQYLGYLEGWPGLLSNYFFKEGFTTSTMELSDYYWDSSLSTSTVITMGVTMFLNYIIQQINDFYISMYDIPEEDYRPSRP